MQRPSRSSAPPLSPASPGRDRRASLGRDQREQSTAGAEYLLRGKTPSGPFSRPNLDPQNFSAAGFFLLPMIWKSFSLLKGVARQGRALKRHQCSWECSHSQKHSCRFSIWCSAPTPFKSFFFLIMGHRPWLLQKFFSSF